MPRKANPDRPKYAQLIAEAREQKHLSQLELGKLIGRDAASVKKYEGGKVVPPFFVLMKIADELSLDKRELANLVIKEDSSDKWLDAAFEEIAWVFTLIKADVNLQEKSEHIIFSYDARERAYNKLDFLFKISGILQYAHMKFNEIAASETDEFVKGLFRGNNKLDD